MNIQQIKELWVPGYRNTSAGTEWWDSKAPFFAEKAPPTAEDSIAFRLISENDMLSAGSTALDVGCGAGRFCFAMEGLGAVPTGTDLSPEMIRLARENAEKRCSAARFSVDDWVECSLEEKGWAKSFDLVLANMTPAVVSADSFLKLIEASRGWVVMVKPFKRSNRVFDELCRLLGQDRDREKLDEALAYAFDCAWLSGGRPKLEYHSEVWDMEQPLDKAVHEYTAKLSSLYKLDPSDEKTISRYLDSIAVDGIVREQTNTDIAAMYWQV